MTDNHDDMSHCRQVFGIYWITDTISIKFRFLKWNWIGSASMYSTVLCTSLGVISVVSPFNTFWNPRPSVANTFEQIFLHYL